MKPFLKAFIFLAVLFAINFLFRQGLVAHFLPFSLPGQTAALLLYSIFAFLAWWVSKQFVKSDNADLRSFGISMDKKNRWEFFYGFLLGVALWAIVSVLQSASAGFSWILRSDISPFNILYGFIFILIADLGTELWYRGYGLSKLKDSFGSNIAIVIMVLFVGLISYSPSKEGELLLYSMLIPALHTLFFSIIYFKTKRLGAALGMHVGGNFITISIFDLRVAQPNQAIPSGVFQSDVGLETISLTAVQLPWVLMAALISVGAAVWWKRSKK